MMPRASMRATVGVFLRCWLLLLVDEVVPTGGDGCWHSVSGDGSVSIPEISEASNRRKKRGMEFLSPLGIFPSMDKRKLTG